MEAWTKEKLIEELKKKEAENKALIQKLKQVEDERLGVLQTSLVTDLTNHHLPPKTERPLTNAEVARYSRQLILPDFGPARQKKLSGTSVLIIGCGGLGCPAAVYLAAAGVGRLGLLDYDVVEISNLHRQILHTESRIGVSKAVSVAYAIRSLNSHVEVVPYEVALKSNVTMGIVSKYDIILDCTDNVATRYLLNDACVMANKPLVSGAALGFEGQLTVYHHEGGPCYRCLHPKPPPPETVTNCSDGGVVGVVPGLMGCMQALEAIKIATGLGTPLSQKLILFDARQCSFRVIKLRGSSNTCEACGDNPSITELIDYEQFCGAAATDKEKAIAVISRRQRKSVEEYKAIVDLKIPHVLVDVRSPVEFEICHLPNCLNIPLKLLCKLESISLIKNKLESDGVKTIICVCRRGNDSQRAVQSLESMCNEQGYHVTDIIGGLTAWAHQIDSSFPVY